MSIKVSVIVPVYNGEKYIKSCIDSILNSSLKEIEIILVNDGSTDNSKMVLEEYSKFDSRIKVLNQENSGPAVARNNGIKVARGKYIGFVDCDDYIDKDMYKVLFELADKNDIQIAMCNYKEINTFSNVEDKVLHNLKSNYIYKDIEIKKNIVSTFTKENNRGFFCLWNKIYLRKWLITTDIIMDESRMHGEDWLFNMELFMKLESFTCTDKVLYNYIHINNNSLMLKYNENQFELFLEGRLKVMQLIPKELIDFNNFNKNFVNEFSAYIINTYKNVKDKKKRKALIKNVINNDEVKKCCEVVGKLPVYFTVTTFLIKNNLNLSARLIYKIISVIV